jgi:glycosyltransferase involved in cell wall biosynthesis
VSPGGGIRATAVIPALDEEATVGGVVAAIPRDRVQEVIVVDNGSRDATARHAAWAGARVVTEPARGYGAACLAGIAAAGGAEVIVFLDADHSDDPREAALLLDRIAEGYDLVVGSRVLGQREPGALLPQARFGNWLAAMLIRLRFGFRYTDLGPFRAIRADALRRIGMRDRDYGWTIEMQMKALRHGLRVCEVPVSYRPRPAGKSKVTGSLAGSVRAGVKILLTFARHALGRG